MRLPSNNFFPSTTPEIWTTDRSGRLAITRAGASASATRQATSLTTSVELQAFVGGCWQSPFCSYIAEPELRWDEVKDIVKHSCDRIDTSGGQDDGNGHSRLYGFGQVNAKKAVELAMPAQPGNGCHSHGGPLRSRSETCTQRGRIAYLPTPGH